MKKFFTAGLLIWLPLAITLWLLEKLVRWGDLLIQLLPRPYQPQTLFGMDIPGLGLLLGLVVVLLTGMLVANFLGQKIVLFWEHLVSSIPLVRTVYQGVKQMAETFLTSQNQSFKEVVLVEFPREGAWTYGFVVSETSDPALKALADDVVTVYIPTAPNPTSGYAVMMSRRKLKVTQATVEEALKFHLSLGLMGPKEDAVKVITNKTPSTPPAITSKLDENASTTPSRDA